MNDPRVIGEMIKHLCIKSSQLGVSLQLRTSVRKCIGLSGQNNSDAQASMKILKEQK